MKYILFFTISLFFSTLSVAQRLRIDSTRFFCNTNPVTFDEISAIIQTQDKGFLFTGTAAKPGGGILPTCPGTRGVNPVIGKLDSLGHIQWIKSFCDTSYSATTLCQTSDGGFAIDGTHNPLGMPLCRYSAQGTFRWKKEYGLHARAGISQIITTPDQGFLLLGFASDRDSDITVTYDYPPQLFYTHDWVLIKVDSLGNKQWVKTLGTSGDDGVARVLAIDGYYYVIGDTYSKDHDCADTTNHPGSAIYTIKLDSAGNVLWSRARGAGFVSQVIYDERDHSILVTGRTYGRLHEMANLPRYGMDDIFLMKLDTAATFKWANMYGTNKSELDGTTLCKAPNGGYFIAGNANGTNTSSPAQLISVDSNGQLLDHRVLSGQVGYATHSIFPYQNSFCLFGVSIAPRAPEGAGTNCPANYFLGASRALTFSKLSVEPLGIRESSAPSQAFSLSPNPTRNSVTIRFEGNHDKGLLTITTLDGKQLYQQEIAASEQAFQVNTAAWPSGTYLVHWQPENHPSQSQKLVVQ